MFIRLIIHLFRTLPLAACIVLPALRAHSSTESAAEDSAIYYGSLSMLTATHHYEPDKSLRYDGYGIKAGLLYDVETKKIVWQKEMNKSFPIASLTKMMVALIVVEDIKNGKLNWDDAVTWTRDIAIGKRRKKKIIHTKVSNTLRELFKAAMIASNNEASQQMAIFAGGGSLSSFIDRMNKRALEMGMNSTYFGNPTGLPAAIRSLDNSASPLDLLTLALEMIKYPEIMEVTGMGYADVYNGSYMQQLRNHNRLTIDYSGEVDGMKTGYTRRAGFCLVATSNKCDYRLISVALGSTAPGTRNDIVKGLINEYYTSVGLDRLGPYCHAPADDYALNPSQALADPNADYIWQTKQVRKTHVVKRGQHLGAIAQKYNCTVSEIRRWNRLRSSRVIAGQKLKVYASIREKVYVRNPVTPEVVAAENQENPEESIVNESPMTNVDAGSPNADTKPEGKKYVIYKVQRGDTLFSIARKHEGSSVQELKQINNINNIRSLKVGTRLKVPVNS